MTKGFGGDVGVVPRQFLRQVVEVMDIADESPDFEPMAELGFMPRELSEDERRAVDGEPPFDAEADDDVGYQAVAVDW